MPGTLDAWIGEIFSGTLREPRVDAWPLVRDYVLQRIPRADTDLLEHAKAQLYTALNQLWRLHVTLAFQGLWAWRLRAVHEGCRLGSRFLCAQVQAALGRRIKVQLAVASMSRQDSPRRRVTAMALRALGEALSDGALVGRSPAPPPAVDCHVLLFDGGSRGNPGAGGFGVLILRLVPGQPAAVLWARAGFMPDRATTNNQAELPGPDSGHW